MASKAQSVPDGIFSLLDTDLYKLTMQCAVLKYFPRAGEFLGGKDLTAISLTPVDIQRSNIPSQIGRQKCT
jgi:hypothetical protein